MAERRAPVQDTLLVLLMPAAALLMLGIAALEASATTYGWMSFAVALAAGFLPAGVLTVVFAREGRLFLSDEAAITKNRRRISRFGVPAGWLLGAAIVAGFATGGLALVVALGAGAGALLGFWPGLLANYRRLRREGWPT